MTAAGGWVLLVEDDPDDRELTLHALRRSGFDGRVELAGDGVEALDLLFARGRWSGRDPDDRPGVILLDLKMPLVNGIEVLREIKHTEPLRDVPVVMLTSSAEDGDLETCYGLGANSYIVKPVDIDQFFTAVEQVGRYWILLNQKPRGTSDAIGFARSRP